jgi:hypothetical protein
MVGDPSAADEPAPPEPVEFEEGDDDESWIDAGHAFVEQRIFAPVLRLDRFFSDERDLEAERSRSFIRWRNEVRFEHGTSTPTFNTGVSATLRLPGLRKQLRRLRVEVAGQTRDAISALFPERGVGDETPAERLGSADAGLGLRIWDRLRSHGDLGAGVLLRLPPGVYGRARVRSILPLGRRLLSRQAVTGFWRTDTRFGTSASADLERPLASSMIARLLGSATLTEVSRGVEWLGDVAFVATFQDRSGAQVGASVTGATDALAGAPPVERYRVYTRFRQDFYRHWVFVELEPEYAWPWTPERGRRATWGVALRLEVQFRGNEAPQQQERDSRSGPGSDGPAPLDALSLAAHAPG